MDTTEQASKLTEVSRQVEKVLRYYERGIVGREEAQQQIVLIVHQAYEQSNEEVK